ncbi:Protein NEDD1 [Chionoecetes opilio]|uniref:Protein NEDD1 n=1 Tax=Chionoecetes opilio TaxID=41210 RepID=A0A8J4XNW1_CHIOP|nr:Protein NEDD1 [Chionoecetes opilio]
MGFSLCLSRAVTKRLRRSEEYARMGETLLATSGDTIKLWDATSYAFCHEIPSESGHVNRLAWNQDGQCLASLGDAGKEIRLLAICGKSEANIGVVRGIEAPTCLSFACRSPYYLGVGNASGAVTIWNVKSQAKKKVFAPSERAITRLAFSHSDSHIAAGTNKGTLHMLSIVNSLTAGPFQLFNNQVVTDLTYSRVKKSLLGCCSEGGAVALYDTHASKVVHAFPAAHSSPVAAIAFSPVNEFLMVSVGYDKKLSCFNVQNRQSVMTHRSAAPLTSIAFLGMGQLVALGTMTGQVFIHDMRSIRTPLATLKAHKTTVTNVLLQPCPKSKSVSSSKAGQRNNTAATLKTPAHRPARSCNDQPTEMSPELRAPQDAPSEPTDFDLSVFSPIRNTNQTDQVQTCEASALEVPQDFKIDLPVESGVPLGVFSPVRTTALQPGHYTPLAHQLVDINEGNLLSPIRDTNLTMRSDTVNSESPASQVKLSTAMEVTITPPEDITDKENIEPLVGVMEQSSSLQQTDYKSTFTFGIPDVPPGHETLTTSCLLQEAVVNIKVKVKVVAYAMLRVASVLISVALALEPAVVGENLLPRDTGLV